MTDYQQTKLNATQALLNAINNNGFTITKHSDTSYSFNNQTHTIHVHTWDGTKASFSDCTLNAFEVYCSASLSPTGYSNQFAPDLLQALQATLGLVITLKAITG